MMTSPLRLRKISKNHLGKVNEQQLSEQAAEESEQQQATEQWLRRIPDDPGGLWRRKFLYQYQKQQNQGDEKQPW